MPIFEYQCKDCGAQFEKISYTSSEKILCKKCASAHVEKLLSVFAVSGASSDAPACESGPCGCGAGRRGMCGG